MGYYGAVRWVTMGYYGYSGIINKNIVTHRNSSELIKFYSRDERDERDKRDNNEVGYQRNLSAVSAVSVVF